MLCEHMILGKDSGWIQLGFSGHDFFFFMEILPGQKSFRWLVSPGWVDAQVTA